MRNKNKTPEFLDLQPDVCDCLNTGEFTKTQTKHTVHAERRELALGGGDLIEVEKNVFQCWER